MIIIKQWFLQFIEPVVLKDDVEESLSLSLCRESSNQITNTALYSQADNHTTILSQSRRGILAFLW